MNGYTDLAGDISVRDFRMLVLTPALSSDRKQIVIPLSCIANPIVSGDITVYEYSIDNGSSWETMTTSSTLTGLAFTAAGTTNSIAWEAKTDIAASIYNTYIRVRFKATSGLYTTAYATYIIYFAKQTINAQLSQGSPFPADYKGTPGTELLRNAPRSSVSA